MAESFNHWTTGDRIVLDVSPRELTKSGLIVPQGSNSEGHEGEILTVGTAVKDNRLKPGQKVLFSRFAGTEFKDADIFGKRTIKIIREEDILLILQPHAKLQAVN